MSKHPKFLNLLVGAGLAAALLPGLGCGKKVRT